MTTTQYKTTTPQEASRQDFVPITSAYSAEEYHLLDKALDTLGNIKYLLVSTLEGIHIYRHRSGVNLIKEER